MDGLRWSQYLLGDVSTTELLCVAHWNTLRHLQSSSWFAAYPLQPTECPISVDDGEALASLSLLEWSVSAITRLQVIADVQIYGLIKPHKWKCPTLSQFHEGYVIDVWQFRYGHERRQWE